MKILALSDTEAKSLYDYYRPGRLKGYDLILACGDLRVDYLEFLVTMASCPLLYVHGNHDEGWRREPEGCICIDDRVYEYRGIRILGLGGAYRYREGRWLFTERQMKRRILRLSLALRRSGGFDILLTHAPARGLNDFDSLSHRGFECFRTLLEKYRPKFFIHGHVHRSYGKDIPKICCFGETTVVNAWEYCVIDTEESGMQEEDRHFVNTNE